MYKWSLVFYISRKNSLFCSCSLWLLFPNICGMMQTDKYSVNNANIFSRSLFFLLAEPGKLCFAQFLVLNYWFAIFVSDRMHHFRMLIRRLIRLVWWLTALLWGCDFWDHFCNFHVHIFSTISDFCVENVVFVDSIPDVHHQQRREKTRYYQNKSKLQWEEFEWGVGCLFSLLVHRDVLYKDPIVSKVRSYQQH